MLQDIREAVETGLLKAGDRLEPIRSLADRYAVSFTSARNAVAQLAREGVVCMKQGHGTFIADERSRRVGESICDDVCIWLDPRRHVIDQITNQLVEQLQSASLPTLIGTWSSSQDPARLKFMTMRWKRFPPRALVTQWSSPGFDQTLKSLLPKRTRVVTTFRRVSKLDVCWHSVDPDLQAAARMAGEHAIALGHKRIGLIIAQRRGPKNHPESHHASTTGPTPQIKGVGQAVRQAGDEHQLRFCKFQYYKDVKTLDDLIPANMIDSHDPTNLQRIRQWLSEPNRPTVMIGTDYDLLAVKKVALSMGLSIPGDMAFVGLGDTPWSQQEGFDSVSYQPNEIANLISDLVLDQSTKLDRAVCRILVQPQLVVR
jgi:DNA-binding LacI/PurR family transcriptional regulator